MPVASPLLCVCSGCSLCPVRPLLLVPCWHLPLPFKTGSRVTADLLCLPQLRAPCPSRTTPRHSSHTEPQSSGAWTRWGTHGTPLWVPTARAELGTEKILKTHLKDRHVDERVHHRSRPDPSKWAGGHRKQRGFFWEILENQQVFFFPRNFLFSSSPVSLANNRPRKKPSTPTFPRPPGGALERCLRSPAPRAVCSASHPLFHANLATASPGKGNKTKETAS